MSYETHCCQGCKFLAVDNDKEQTGPAIWCSRGHFDGIGSADEANELTKTNDCPDFDPLNRQLLQ